MQRSAGFCNALGHLVDIHSVLPSHGQPGHLCYSGDISHDLGSDLQLRFFLLHPTDGTASSSSLLPRWWNLNHGASSKQIVSATDLERSVQKRSSLPSVSPTNTRMVQLKLICAITKGKKKKGEPDPQLL